jgi:hypothetical protein
MYLSIEFGMAVNNLGSRWMPPEDAYEDPTRL